jgi:hypothetical protein
MSYRTEEIKIECLRLANTSNHDGVRQYETTVKAAEAFFAFVTSPDPSAAPAKKAKK